MESNKIWITNLQRLLALDVEEGDILIVKLTTIINEPICVSETKLCSAHILKNDKKVIWYVTDYIGSDLVIETPADSTELGFTASEMDDTGAKLIYVLTGCRLIKSKVEPEHNFAVRTIKHDELVSYAGTHREAECVKRAMHEIGLTCRIVNTDETKKT